MTSKSELEKLVKDIESKEKYLNLLSKSSFHISELSFPTAQLICTLVTNAGVSGPKAPPDSSSASELQDKIWHAESVEDWGDVMKTNVTSVYFTTLAFLPLLQASIGTNSPLALPLLSSSLA